MKNINYKQLKNLPKYDFGTRPIDSGYQQNYQPIQTNDVIQQYTPITSSYTPMQAIADSSQNAALVAQLGSKLSDVAKASAAVNPTAQTLATTSPTINTFGGVTVTNAGKVAGGTISEVTNPGYSTAVNAHNSATAASTAATAAARVAGGLAAAYGGYQSIVAADQYGRSPLSGNDLMNSATKYSDGTIGGYDVPGANKLLKDYNNAGMTKSVSSGLTFGAGAGSLIGSFIPGGTIIGGVLGAGLGALGGAITGWINRGKAKRKMHDIQRRFADTVSAYNTQIESVNESNRLKNQYYATHADEGLSIDTKNPNALVQGGEPIIKTDKNGNFLGATMFPITALTPERVDNIPVRLDKGSTKDGVIGNKINPFTGNRFAVDARPLVMAVNDPSISEAERQAMGQELVNMANMQQYVKDNRPMKADKGRSIKKYDLGDYIVPAISYLSNWANIHAAKQKNKNMPITTYNAYTQNKNALQAGQLMQKTYDIYPQLQSINDQARFADYAIRRSAFSPGQKLAMLSNLYNARMQNVSKAYADKITQESTMRNNYAKWLFDWGAQNQQLESAYGDKAYDRLAKASAIKLQRGDMLDVSEQKNNNDLAQNIWNILNANKLTSLYRQDLDTKLIKDLYAAGQNAQADRLLALRRTI